MVIFRIEVERLVKKREMEKTSNYYKINGITIMELIPYKYKTVENRYDDDIQRRLNLKAKQREKSWIEKNTYNFSKKWERTIVDLPLGFENLKKHSIYTKGMETDKKEYYKWLDKMKRENYYRAIEGRWIAFKYEKDEKNHADWAIFDCHREIMIDPHYAYFPFKTIIGVDKVIRIVKAGEWPIYIPIREYNDDIGKLKKCLKNDFFHEVDKIKVEYKSYREKNVDETRNIIRKMGKEHDRQISEKNCEIRQLKKEFEELTKKFNEVNEKNWNHIIAYT